jgi:branched-chain amino acid transport system ATP-binding protein
MALTIENLTVGYGAADALTDVSLRADMNTLTALVGPNGAGKTTLLSAISGLVRPRAGRILWKETAIRRPKPDSMVRAGIAHVPEGRRMLPGLTVLDNLHIGALAAGQEPDRLLDLVLDIFPEVKELLHRESSALSGGQQQMVAIGRGLMADPQMLMVDELSLGLAPKLAQRLVDALGQLIGDHGIGVLVVDQNVRLLQRVASRFHVLTRGRIVFAGPADELTADSAFRAYMGSD